MKSKVKILIIVCNFNQVFEVESFLSRLRIHWPQNDILFIDDGSTDGSPELAEKLGFEVIRQSRNLGIGAAIRTGIQQAQARGYGAVTIMSSNGKMKPEELPRVTGPIERDEADYVTGSRFREGGQSSALPWIRWLAIKGYSFVSGFLLGKFFSDITCGYRCYKIDFLFNDPIRSLDQAWLNRYQMEYYIHYWACERKLRIQEVPVSVTYSHLPAHRQSKIKLSRDAFSILLPFFLLKFRLKS